MTLEEAVVIFNACDGDLDNCDECVACLLFDINPAVFNACNLLSEVEEFLAHKAQVNGGYGSVPC